jgi:DNA-binding MarR family transcriptional regulator
MEQKNDVCKGMPEEGSEGELHAAKEFPLSFSIFGLARSHRGLAAQLIRETGLFPGQEIMLMQLWHQDCQSQNSLCRILRLDHSTVAKSVRRLEDAGLVTRSRLKEDGRVTIVSLTQAGRDLESKVLDAWSSLENMTTGGLTEQEKTLFVTLSRKIAAVVDSYI